MAAKKDQGELTANEGQRLEQRLRRGAQGARKLRRARILLNAAVGRSAEESAQEVDRCVATMERTRTRVASSRLGALEARPRPGRNRCLDVHGEARLSAEAWSPAPGGREHGTGQVLADRAVELPLAESGSDDTGQRLLKKTRSSRGGKRRGGCRKAGARWSRPGRRAWRCRPSPLTPRGPRGTLRRRVAT